MMPEAQTADVSALVRALHEQAATTAARVDTEEMPPAVRRQLETHLQDLRLRAQGAHMAHQRVLHFRRRLDADEPLLTALTAARADFEAQLTAVRAQLADPQLLPHQRPAVVQQRDAAMAGIAICESGVGQCTMVPHSVLPTLHAHGLTEPMFFGLQVVRPQVERERQQVADATRELASALGVEIG
jgi:hypothetical protein